MADVWLAVAWSALMESEKRALKVTSLGQNMGPEGLQPPGDGVVAGDWVGG